MDKTQNLSGQNAVDFTNEKDKVKLNGSTSEEQESKLNSRDKDSGLSMCQSLMIHHNGAVRHK